MNIYTETAAPATETATDSTAPRAQSWRDTLPIHPAAELFPRMSPDELAALGEDIEGTGSRRRSRCGRTDTDRRMQLLDGRNRLDAIEIAIGGPVDSTRAPSIIGTARTCSPYNKVIVLDSSVDPYAYVITANIHRRHLTAEQKRELIAKLIKADPAKSDRQIAETVKASHTTVGTGARRDGGDVAKFPTWRRGPTARAASSPRRKTTTKSTPVYRRRRTC